MRLPDHDPTTQPSEERGTLVGKANFDRPSPRGEVPEAAQPGSAMPFERFVETVYITTSLPLMASSTQDRYRGIIDNYLILTFGSL
jgi:hypothetical protein